MIVTRRWRWLMALLAALALLLAACGEEEQAQEEPRQEGTQFEEGTTMARLQDKGEIVIGVKFDVPPFGFKNPTTGRVEGFDVDMGNMIAEELGVRPRFIEAISDNRIPFIKDGTVDLILSTMTITTDRDAEIDFSRPYYVARGRILVRKDTTDIQGVQDLAGKRVCTTRGSTYEDTLKKQARNAELRLVDTYSECLELLTTRAIDAVSTDDVILTGMVIQSKDVPLELVGGELTTEPYGAGMKEGDKAFQQFVNGVIENTFETGRWEDLYQKWVGRYTGESPEDPRNYTLKDALELFPCEETC